MKPTAQRALALIVSAALVAACGRKGEAPTAGATASAVCAKVTMANMSWQSAEVLANIDGIILSKGYGCEVELAPGDTMPTLTAMILETAVGRARVGHCGPVWVGETTQQACCRKAEQRPQAGPQWLNRARSAVTQKLRLRVGTKVSVHAVFQAEMSGQLRFLG